MWLDNQNIEIDLNHLSKKYVFYILFYFSKYGHTVYIVSALLYLVAKNDKWIYFVFYMTDNNCYNKQMKIVNKGMFTEQQLQQNFVWNTKRTFLCEHISAGNKLKSPEHGLCINMGKILTITKSLNNCVIEHKQ